MSQQVMSMLGCTQEEAESYLESAGGDVLKAIESNIVIPKTEGNKYIPEKPVVHDGLSDEARTKLAQARQLSELFNASFRNDLRATQKTSEVGVGAVAGGSVVEKPEEQVVVEVPQK